MMIIAVMMGAMLMPAQMFAKNDRVDEKPRVENNEKRKEIRIGNDRDNKPADNKPNVKPDNRPNNKLDNKPNYKPDSKPNIKPNDKPNNKPKNDFRPNNNPGKPAPVVIVNNPVPKPQPPRYNDNDGIFDAIAGFLSIVGIMALVAN